MGNLVVEKKNTFLLRENYKKLESKAAKMIADLIVNSYVLGVKTKKRIVGVCREDAGLTKLIEVVESLVKGICKGFYITATSMEELCVEIKKMVVCNKERIVRVASITMISVLVCLILTAMMVYATGITKNLTFSKEKWNKNTSKRSHMIESLEEKYDIIGMSRGSVEDLLGVPYSSVKKDVCEYRVLRDCDFDVVVEYRINSGSMSTFDLLEKHYAIAYKNGNAVWADVIIADITE